MKFRCGTNFFLSWTKINKLWWRSINRFQLHKCMLVTWKHTFSVLQHLTQKNSWLRDFKKFFHLQTNFDKDFFIRNVMKAQIFHKILYDLKGHYFFLSWCCPAPPHIITLFKLDFNVKFPLLSLLHFLSDLKSTILCLKSDLIFLYCC